MYSTLKNTWQCFCLFVWRAGYIKIIKSFIPLSGEIGGHSTDECTFMYVYRYAHMHVYMFVHVYQLFPVFFLNGYFVSNEVHAHKCPSDRFGVCLVDQTPLGS